jgi:hypothetical protein
MELFNKTYVLTFIANSTKIHYYKMEFKVKILIQISFGSKLISIPSMWNLPAWNLHKLEEHTIILVLIIMNYKNQIWKLNIESILSQLTEYLEFKISFK